MMIAYFSLHSKSRIEMFNIIVVVYAFWFFIVCDRRI